MLCTDASARGVGGVLCVQRKEKELPVAFYSPQLRGPECRYSASELEALAVVMTVRHFAHYLWGRRFKILTDHRALESLMTSRVLNRRLQNWALQLQDFNFQIEYRPGEQNLDADCLSRQAWENVGTGKEGGGVLQQSKGGCGTSPHEEE